MTQRGCSRQTRANADGACKRILTALLPDCLALVAPDLHEAVDWTVPPVSLDKEFQAVARQAAIGPRLADHLVQVRLRSGEITWLVLHVEVQGQQQDDFAARMYTCAALLHLRLWRQRRKEGRTEPQADWRPGPYEARALDLGVRYDYRAAKLRDWRGREAELIAAGNPLALVVHTWLGVLAARGRADGLLAVARVAWRQLCRGGYGDMQLAATRAFLEQVIALPPALQEQLLADLASEEDTTMAQVTSRFERQGLREGRLEERHELVLLQLDHKFGSLDDDTVARVRALSASRLLALCTALLDFTDRAELDRWLAMGSGA